MQLLFSQRLKNIREITYIGYFFKITLQHKKKVSEMPLRALGHVGPAKIVCIFLSFLCVARLYYDLLGIIYQRIIQSRNRDPRIGFDSFSNSST